jgi:hypothetical protein
MHTEFSYSASYLTIYWYGWFHEPNSWRFPILKEYTFNIIADSHKNFEFHGNVNKTGNVRITWHWVVFVQPLLLWKSSKYYLFWVCVCILIFQHAKHRRHILLLCVACLSLPYSSTWSHKWHSFWKKTFWNVKSVFSFSLQLLFKIFLILRTTERDKIYIGLHVKYQLFSSDFNETAFY